MIAANRRPMPADFAEVAARIRTTSSIARHYRCGQSALYRWAKEAGISLRTVRPIPDDFAAIASTKGTMALVKHYRTNRGTILRWFDEADMLPMHKRPTAPKNPKKPIPADFAAVAPMLTISGIMSHFGVSHSLAKRWLAEAGVAAMVYVHTPSIDRTPTRKTTHFSLAPSGGRGRDLAPIRTLSIYDMAADELRRNRWHVYRCDERGLYAPNGEFWRAGTIVLTPDELLERADRYREKVA